MNNRRILVFFIFFAISFPLFSIELTTPDWEIVADGISITVPEKTSWGYVTVTDGRTLIGWTERGKKIFQRKLKRKPSELLCVDSSDFIWSVSYDMQYLSLFNPDGMLQWEKKLPAKSTLSPLQPGKDGRLFICLENSILCVDMNGRTVWSLQIEGSSPETLSICDDGSLICNGKHHISPFGEYLEELALPIEKEFTSDSRLIHTATCEFTYSTGAKSRLTAFDFDGNELWNKSFAPEKVLYYEITDNMIMTLSESWVIAGYRYNSTPETVNTASPVSLNLYEKSYGISSEEYDYHSLVSGLQRLNQYNNRMTVNPAIRDIVHDLQYIKKAESSGFDFSVLLSDIILCETDPGVLETAVSAAGNIGRDPSGLVFNAIETRLKQRTSFQFDDSMYAAFCDALYAICLKSGTSVRVLKALEIISPLTSTDYHTIVHEHASLVMEKLVQLADNYSI